MNYETYEVRVHANGDRYWYVDDKLHRTDGPAVEWSNGYRAWYADGKRHRTDGPAIERPDGSREWYVDDKLHRTDGPAIECANGYRAWYVDGVEMTEAEFEARGSCEGRVVEIDGKRYRLEAI